MKEYGEQEYVCQVYDLDQPLAYFASDRCQHVVRCRDCRHFERDATPHDATRPHFCCWLGIDLDEDGGFCSWGARM